MAANGAIDFSVGWGANGNTANDDTALAATITTMGTVSGNVTWSDQGLPARFPERR